MPHKLNKNVDTTKTITHISLCAGYGGIDLGLKRAIPNLRTIAFSEIEAFACANLVSKMEAGILDYAPVWTNLKTFPWGKFRGVVDILSGGYPCQPFSAAGKRLGTEDPRHLWPYIADGIAAMRPSVCFFENVEGHISLGLPDVIEDLGRLGYRTTWGIFSASEVGAPHQRKRVFIMAHRKCEGLEGWGCGLQPESNRRGTPNNTWESRHLLAHTMCNGGRESREVRQGADGAIPISNGESRGTWPSRPGQPQFSWEPPRVVANSKLSRLQGSGESHTQEWSEHSENRTGILGGTSDSSHDGAAEGMGNAKRIRLEPTRDEGAMGEEGSDPTGEGCEPSPTSQESSYPSASVGNAASLRPCGGGKDGSGEQPEVFRTGSECPQDQRQIEPSMGGDPNGPANRVGHAELRQPDHADCGAKSEHRGELGDTKHPRSHGTEIGGSINSASEDEQSRKIKTIKSSGTSEPECGADLHNNSDLYTTCDNRTDELRLLGNGVVPATAELAWTTLLKELTKL